MKKLGRKGFMLGEVVVVSVVISTALVTLFIGLNRTTKAYEQRKKFNDIDAMYISMAASDIYLKEKPNYSLTELTGGDYDFLKNGYSGNIEIYYVKNPIDEASIKNKNNHQTFIDYIDYLSKKSYFGDSKYSYLIITEICKDNNDCRYNTLRVTKEKAGEE